MLKAELSKGKDKCSVEVSGNLNEILNDVVNLLRSIATMIDRNDHTNALVFEAILKGELDKGLVRSTKSMEGIFGVGSGKTAEEALDSLLDNITRQEGEE